MPNKAFRILIADPQHFQRLKIEKMLNLLGYYRIAPVCTFNELVTLTYQGSGHFDLLVISSELVAAEGIDLSLFCRDNPQIRHALIYDGQSAQLPPINLFDTSVVQIRLPSPPCDDSIRTFMGVIDPAMGCVPRSTLRTARGSARTEVIRRPQLLKS